MSEIVSYPRDKRVYEVGYIVLPTVGDSAIAESVASLVAIATNNGAEFVSDAAPEFIDLAYSMEKIINNKRVHFRNGYFGWFKFEVTPHAIEKIEKELTDHPEVLRFLLVKTTRENIAYKRKSFHRERERMDETLPEAVLEEVVAEEVVEAEEPLVDNLVELVADDE